MRDDVQVIESTDANVEKWVFARVQEWMRRHPERARPSVGHGLPVVHTPVMA